MNHPAPVLLVRPDANERDARALDALGVESTIDPWLEVGAVPDPGPAHRMLGMLAVSGPRTALVLTSPRTWDFWGGLVGTGALDRAVAGALRRGLRVYCTGAATRESLPPGPAMVAVSAPHGTALAERLLADLGPGQPADPGTGPLALLPGSEIARQELPTALGKAGWRVLRAAVYRTLPRPHPASAGPLSEGAFAAVVVRSPSAVQALQGALGTAGVPATTRIIAGGPSTAAAVRAAGWSPAECPRAGSAELARQTATALGLPAPQTGEPGGDGGLGDEHPLRSGALDASPFLLACRGVRPRTTPVWFMRQAGRSLPEYRAARTGTSMLDSCLDPALAAELTLQPVRRYGVDAAILYSDIMVPLRLAGVGVDIEPGVGPVLHHPVRGRSDVEALPELTAQALEPIREAVRRTVAQLTGVPLIGFAGAPYTVASYLVEGRPDRNHPRTRALMHSDPQTWRALLDWVARIDIAFLRAQVLAGASAVQLFDSWAGELDPVDYLLGVQPASGRVLRAIGRLGVPRIHFGTRTRRLLIAMRDAGADVMGVAADIALDEANRLLGGRTPLQGNIDPAELASPRERLDAHVAAVLAAGAAAPAHIVNLAHGVPRDADPGTLAHIVDLVHRGAPTSEKGQ